MTSGETWRYRTRRFLRRFGVDVQRYPGRSAAFGRTRLVSHHGITLVVDVGANRGQYASELREYGYSGRILSLEPVAEAFASLQARTMRDPSWTALRLAAGPFDGSVSVNVSGNQAASSSVLDMLREHVDAAPESRFVGTQVCEQRRLDGLVGSFARADDRILLKLDVQGYELAVLEGAHELVSRCHGLQMEMSLLPLYDGATSFEEALAFASSAGFRLMHLEPGFTNPRTGRVLQVDGVFFRESS